MLVSLAADTALLQQQVPDASVSLQIGDELTDDWDVWLDLQVSCLEDAGFAPVSVTETGFMVGGDTDQVREAPAIAIQVARGLSDGSFLEHAAQAAFTSGMRAAILVGATLLTVGAVFVWVRGASRDEAVVEDELDLSEAA